MNSPLEALAPHFRHISVATIGLAALLAATDDARAQWAYATTKDAMRGTVATRADLTSRNTHQFSFPYHGGSRLKLIVWSDPDNADADLRQTVGLFITRGQFRCLPSDVCPIHIKVDDGPVEPLSAQLSVSRPVAGEGPGCSARGCPRVRSSNAPAGSRSARAHPCGRSC